jgi:hypothetical protein
VVLDERFVGLDEYSMQQGAIDTIRGNGDNTRIVVSTNDYDSAAYWSQHPHFFTDPANKLEYEAHDYPCTVQGTTKYDASCSTTNLASLTLFAQWCQTNHLRCYLGESGWSGSNTSSDWQSFANWGTQAYNVLDQYGMDATYFVGGGAFYGFDQYFFAYDSTSPGVDYVNGIIATVNHAESQSQIIEAHPTKP